jgi:hypothetical protein
VCDGVLRPCGKFIFFEHGLCPILPYAVAGAIGTLFRLAFEGCHVTRDIPSLIEKGGSFPKSESYCWWGLAVPERQRDPHSQAGQFKRCRESAGPVPEGSHCEFEKALRRVQTFCSYLDYPSPALSDFGAEEPVPGPHSKVLGAACKLYAVGGKN